MHDPILVGGEPGIAGPLRVAHDLARSPEQPVVAAREDERAIRRLERLVRNDVGVRGAQGCRHDPADQCVRRLVHHRRDARVEQRDAHVPSAPGALAFVQGGQRADGRLESGHDVQQGDAGLHGLPPDSPVTLINPQRACTMMS